MNLTNQKIGIFMISIILVLIIAGALAGPIMSNVEQPKYSVIASEKNIEIREYQPVIIAQVEVQGERKEAIGKGFRALADYIFGNNIQAESIAMTSPVQQQPNAKIAMTAPVQQTAKDDNWLIRFVMPSEYTLESLPIPKNKSIQIQHIKSKKYVAIQFSGMSSDKNIEKHSKILLEYVQTHQISIAKQPLYAFYNPPWTLPFMRRNEVMYEVK